MLIGICGAIGSGKSTFAKMLREKNPEYRLYSFADSLKEECSSILPKEALGWNGVDWTGSKTDEGRKLLQSYAEEKRKTDPDCWINAVKAKIELESPKFAVVQDCRYVNELNWIYTEEGIIAYIHNIGREAEFINNYVLKNIFHGSEYQWRCWLLPKNEYQYYKIDNNSDLTNLRFGVEEFINNAETDQICVQTEADFDEEIGF